MEQPSSERGGEQDKSLRIQRFRFGPWLFNVSQALAIIAEHPRDIEAVPVDPWVRYYGLDDRDKGVPLLSAQNLDRDYAMTSDLSEPLLVATLRSSGQLEYFLLIDGMHRLYRAHVEGVAELPVYRLTADESLSIREDPFASSQVHWEGYDRARQVRGADEAEGGE